jgi:tRNA (guanine37-N1)-methyltransferase
MKITILTMFPEMLASLQASPIIRHAITKGILELQITDIRDYAEGSYRHIDDSPYGGGAGMILKCQPVLDALASVRGENSHVVIPVPAGLPYTQKKARQLMKEEDLIFIAGHYEGMDARIYEEAEELLSLGDYIVSGGEYACMIMTDSIVRLLDGVIREDSTADESFEEDLLEYPQFTKPREYQGKKVPEVLFSGNHEKIRRWKKKESLRWTLKWRPDLLEKKTMNSEERELLEEIHEEENR